MKLIIRLMLVLLLPASVFAQSSITLKRQANGVAKALQNGDYGTVIDHMYPGVVKLVGGKEKLKQMLTSGLNQMKAQGAAIQSVTIGEPGKFYHAGTEIHCLVPQTMRIKTASSSIASNSYLLAVSQDKGKNWTFLDLNRNTIAAIPKLFPNFNKDLKLPEPKSVGF